MLLVSSLSDAIAFDEVTMSSECASSQEKTSTVRTRPVYFGRISPVRKSIPSILYYLYKIDTHEYAIHSIRVQRYFHLDDSVL